MPGCEWVLIVKYGDPYTNIPQTTGFGPFPTKEDADSFRAQYYYDQIVIAEIVPLNAVLPESATELDIDLHPIRSLTSEAKLIQINTRRKPWILK